MVTFRILPPLLAVDARVKPGHDNVVC